MLIPTQANETPSRTAKLMNGLNVRISQKPTIHLYHLSYSGITGKAVCNSEGINYCISHTRTKVNARRGSIRVSQTFCLRRTEKETNVCWKLFNIIISDQRSWCSECSGFAFHGGLRHFLCMHQKLFQLTIYRTICCTQIDQMCTETRINSSGTETTDAATIRLTYRSIRL